MTEFWVSSGHHMTLRDAAGGLVATDELILAYLARPELMPPEEACDSERALHAALMAEPRRLVGEGDIAALADADARENWRFMIGFRDRLIGAPTIEAAYLGLVREGAQGVPPLFMNQLVHLILRNALEGCEDPYVLRAAELFFRPQRVSIQDGAALLADAELIEEREADPHQSPLLAMMGRSALSELDVMTPDNAWTYWSRSDAFTMVLNLGADPRSREALGRVMEAWIRHLLGVRTIATPITELKNADWRWYVGLDAEGTRIGDALWKGEAVNDEMRSRLLAKFTLTFEPGTPVLPDVEGRPVYLLLGMTGDRHVRVKPQNLVAGLPLAAPA
jgi:hypothetical protein